MAHALVEPDEADKAMSKSTHRETILVIDFGAQYVQLIVRKVREQSVYAEIRPAVTPLAQLLAERPKGLIFSGGPSSVYEEGAPAIDPAIFETNIPNPRNLLWPSINGPPVGRNGNPGQSQGVWAHCY